MNSRASLYHYLAEALADPPEWLSLPGAQWPLYDTAIAMAQSSSAARQAVLRLQEIPAEPLSGRKRRYQSLFSGSDGRPQVWLYESLHRSGRLAGPQTFAVDRVYKAAGLIPMTTELPDHASLELAFLAFLAAKQEKEGGNEAHASKERNFLEQNAGDWLVDAGRQMIRSGDPVYGPIGQLLADWLIENAYPKRKSRPEIRLPALKNPDYCTLCGFCAQVCPTKAILIRENDFETGLFLLPARCIGCFKCARICDPGALNFVKPVAEEEKLEWQRLFTSPRLACPTCGKPTISAAEMSYMQSILGHTDWLNQCLDCRAMEAVL